jgi:Pyruvate/2-oxoacid:ferredoxin oxidoreductase delta subunit
MFREGRIKLFKMPIKPIKGMPEIIKCKSCKHNCPGELIYLQAKKNPNQTLRCPKCNGRLGKIQ